MKAFLKKVRAKALDNTRSALSIVAFGDSVTQGEMEYQRFEAESTYHRQLQRELEAFFPSCTFNMINAGVSGESAVVASARLDRDVLRHQPDLVIVAFGLNDSVQGEAGEAEFCETLNTIVERIRAEAGSDVVLLTPPLMARRESSRVHAAHRKFMPSILASQNGGALARYAQLIRMVGERHRIPVADVHEEWERLVCEGFDTDTWLINGLNHPNRDGHSLAKTLVFHEIVRAHLLECGGGLQ